MTRARLLPRSAEGFTLLEVLVAVLVLSVGLLGLAGLQTVGLRQNHNAFMRSQATMLAYDIIDRMRSNRTAAATGSYDRVWATNCPIPPPASPPDCATTACELNSWIRSLRAVLPCGDAGVATVGGVVTVTVVWDDNRSGKIEQAPDLQPPLWDPQFAMSTQL